MQIARLFQIVEMKEWSARYATDVISLCAFGIDANSLKNPNAEFRANGAKILAPTLNNIIRLMINFLAPDVARWFQVCFVTVFLINLIFFV